MARGRKVKTAQNSTTGFIRRETLDATSELTAVSQAEYDRLIGVLTSKGILDRVDLAVVVEAARCKEYLDRCYAILAEKPSLNEAKLISVITTQRRALLRELGLTVKPSNSRMTVNAVPPETMDPISARIKLSG